MKKNVLVFGLISGLLISIFMSASMIYASKNPGAEHGTNSMLIGYLSMLIAFSLIFVAVKTYRDKQNTGVISFGQALKMGLLIALIGSTMYVLSWALVYNLYLPDFMDKYAESMIKHAKPEELQAITKKAQEYKEMYKNPLMFTFMTYMEILPVGLIVALITALILKRKKAVVA
ncbi:MAG: DUF4199 domain-containing protein [Chitinophagaceae bacterium]|nr:DUF4199 domain-containing protein [Chitinophagaceae bacterium]